MLSRRSDDLRAQRAAPFVLAAAIACGSIGLVAAANQDPEKPPATQSVQASVGIVSGKVTAENARSLPEMVIYLEPADPNRRFPAPATPAVISQKGAQFSPSLLVVCVGQTVEFRNDEDRAIEHNVFSRSPTKPFDLGLYRPGVTKTETFDQPGPVRLYCSIHRHMDGMIYVCPTPYFATVGQDGSFVIRGVPAGQYDVKTWQSRQRFREQTLRIEVEPDKEATANFVMSRK